ncbi:MAG: hypothetical protein ACLR7U_08190 [Ruthenibacterium lactatiformans]
MPSPASATIDLTDEYYEAEELALDEAYTRLDNRMNELTGAILESGYGKAARARWGDGFVERYEVNSKLNSPEIEELSIQEQALVSEYQKRPPPNIRPSATEKP